MRFACHGGCPKDRFTSTPDGEPGLHYLCPSYKEFFAHIEPTMRAMCDLLARGPAPSELVQVYAAEDAKRGRNEPCTCGSGRKWKHCHGSDHPQRDSSHGDDPAVGTCRKRTDRLRLKERSTDD